MTSLFGNDGLTLGGAIVNEKERSRGNDKDLTIAFISLRFALMSSRLSDDVINSILNHFLFNF
jgi:hypothetical protein